MGDRPERSTHEYRLLTRRERLRRTLRRWARKETFEEKLIYYASERKAWQGRWDELDMIAGMQYDLGKWDIQEDGERRKSVNDAARRAARSIRKCAEIYQISQDPNSYVSIMTHGTVATRWSDNNVPFVIMSSGLDVEYFRKLMRPYDLECHRKLIATMYGLAIIWEGAARQLAERYPSAETPPHKEYHMVPFEAEMRTAKAIREELALDEVFDAFFDGVPAEDLVA